MAALKALPGSAPSPRDLERNASRVVMVLIALHGVDRRAVAAHLGMSESAFSRAMTGQRHWHLDDLASLGEFFDVAATSFLEPVEKLPLDGTRPSVRPTGGTTDCYPTRPLVALAA